MPKRTMVPDYVVASNARNRTVSFFRSVCFFSCEKSFLPREPKVSISQKRLEVTSPAIAVLNAFLDSPDLPKEGLSGLLWKCFWRDALIRRYLDVLFVIQLKCSTQLYYEQSYLRVYVSSSSYTILMPFYLV